MFDGFGRRLAPGKWSMASHQHAGHGDRIEAGGPEMTHDNGPRIANVAFGNFIGRERLCNGNRTMEVVCVCGSKARNGAGRLRPLGGELRMGMDDAADLGKLTVKQRVRVQIARRTQ